MKNMDPKVTDVTEETDKHDSVDREVDGESVSHPSGRRTKQSRMEKKSRNMLSRFGLKPVEGVVKITIRKSKHVLFSIVNPEVFKCPSSDVYIVFGDAKIDDGSSQASAAPYKYPVTSFPSSEPIPSESWPAPASEIKEELVETTGLEEKDIQLVMAQCRCKREDAVAALRKNNNDLVESIMSLSAC